MSFKATVYICPSQCVPHFVCVSKVLSSHQVLTSKTLATPDAEITRQCSCGIAYVAVLQACMTALNNIDNFTQLVWTRPKPNIRAFVIASVCFNTAPISITWLYIMHSNTPKSPDGIPQTRCDSASCQRVPCHDKLTDCGM